MPKICFFLCLTLFLSACSSSSGGQKTTISRDVTTRNASSSVSVPGVKRRDIPLNPGKVHSFSCRNAVSFTLKVMDNNKETLELKYQGATHRLKRQNTLDPAIYSNGQLAIYANEQGIVLGRDYGAEILAASCNSL